jgi:hypothetical protein
VNHEISLTLDEAFACDRKSNGGPLGNLSGARDLVLLDTFAKTPWVSGVRKRSPEAQLRDGRAGTLLPRRPGEVAARPVAGFTTHLKLAPSVGRRRANHACSAYRLAHIPVRTPPVAVTGNGRPAPERAPRNAAGAQACGLRVGVPVK